MQKIFTLLFTLVLFFSGFSQQAGYRVFTGIIINASTREPLAYATVSLSKNGIKTLSNEAGKFILKIPAEDKSDSIYITHIGFRPLKLLADATLEGNKTIRLEKEFNTLTAVVVKTVVPVELLRNAIAKIPENYPTSPYKTNGFYRMTGKKEKSLVSISEAAFETWNEDYSNKKKDFKLIRSREDMDVPAFGGFDGISYGDSPKEIVGDDIISNVKESDILSESAIRDHVFVYRGVLNYNGQQAYEIDFRGKEGLKKPLYDGKIFIATDNLAFLQFTKYRTTSLKYWSFSFKNRLAMKLVNINMDWIKDSEVITYAQYGDKYYLNHAYEESHYHIIGGKRHFELNPLKITLNLLIAKIDTVNITEFAKGEVYHSNRLMEAAAPDYNTDSTDAFWGDYNLIMPEFNVDSASRVIRADNELQDHKHFIAGLLRNLKKDPAVRVDSLLSYYYYRRRFNGTALVVSEGKVILEKGYGLASKEKKMVNDGQTQFRIGSTSKQFTSMLIMQLVNENRLQLNDTVGKFLPWYVNGRVTIEQLLTHQSGVPDYLNSRDDLTSIIGQPNSTDELVKKFCSDSLEFEPGTEISYSNSGYLILADIIEKITRKKYAEVLKEKIFIPVGMIHSYFGKQGQDTTHLATGYIQGEPEMNYVVENEVGAGGITSTAEDLLLWHNALLTDKLLPKDKMEELFKPRVRWDEWGADYGYGWMIDRLKFDASKEHTIVYHPGTELGFYDMLVRQPDKNIFIILLSNQSDFPRFDITDLILNVLNDKHNIIQP